MSDIHNKIRKYFAGKRETIAVYLFGSHATGKEQPVSDIDIGILFDDMDQDLMLKERNSYLVELGRILRKDIHPVILNTAGEGLLKQIFSKGQCLLVNDEKKHAYKKMVMFVKMAEFAYYKNNMQSALIKRVMED